MLILLKTFLDICMFRLGPQDLPASPFFLKMVFFANAAVMMIIFTMEAPFVIALPQFLVSIALLVCYCWILLSLSHKRIRFCQTLTALLGTDTLITLIALPFFLWISLNRSFGWPLYILQASMLWSIAVVGHIIRHALSSSYFFGLGLAIVYFMASFQAMSYLFAAH